LNPTPPCYAKAAFFLSPCFPGFSAELGLVDSRRAIRSPLAVRYPLLARLLETSFEITPAGRNFRM